MQRIHQHPSRTRTTATWAETMHQITWIVRLILISLLAHVLPAGEVWFAGGDLGRTPLSLHGIKAVARGTTHALALKHDGTVVAWGKNDGLQCTVPPGLTGVTAIAAGKGYSMALKGDGTVVWWGDKKFTVGITDVVAISANYYQASGIRNDGTVVQWGDNLVPVPTGLSGVVGLSVGAYASFAWKADGSVSVWGSFMKELDFGQWNIPAGLSVASVAAGDQHTVALRKDGTVVAWGLNNNGQCNTPAGLSGVIAVNPLSALKGTGELVTWGPGASGTTVLNQVQAVAEFGGRIALRNDGSVVAWSGNVIAKSFNIDTTDTVAPGFLSNVSRMVVNNFTNIALKSDGTIMRQVDGSVSSVTNIIAVAGDYALKGDGTVVTWQNAPSPVPAGLSGVVALACGYGSKNPLALKSDGTVVTWGTGQASTVPSGLTGVIAIASGLSNSVALKSDGTVVVWGSDTYGMNQVPRGLSGVRAIATGDVHVLALRQDGTVVAWGGKYSNSGQVAVPEGLSGVTAIEAGRFHSVALKSDGSVVTWGDARGAALPAGLPSVTEIAATGGNSTWFRAASRPVNLMVVHDATVIANGSAQVVNITTGNGRTPTSTTYNGSYLPPSNPGTYTVMTESDYVDSYGSATGTLVILPATGPSIPSFIIHPESLTVAPGGLATFLCAITGNPAPTLQWQRSNDGGSTWNAIANASLTNFIIPTVLTTDSGAQFRCQASNSAGTVFSSAATLTVEPRWSSPPSINPQPTDSTVTSGQTATFGANVTVTDSTAIQWWKSDDDGITWSSIPGATSVAYTTPATTASENGQKFRLTATNPAGSMSSYAVTLTVKSQRNIAIKVLTGYQWYAIAPLNAIVNSPVENVQTIQVLSNQQTILALIPTTSN